MLDLYAAADVMRTAEIASLTTRVRNTALLASRLVHPLWSEGTAEGQILTAGRSPKVGDIEQNPAVALSWVAGTHHLLIEATAAIHRGEAVQALRAALASAPHGYRPENFWSSTDLGALVVIKLSAARMELSTFATGGLVVGRWNRPE